MQSAGSHAGVDTPGVGHRLRDRAGESGEIAQGLGQPVEILQSEDCVAGGLPEAGDNFADRDLQVECRFPRRRQFRGEGTQRRPHPRAVVRRDPEVGSPLHIKNSPPANVS